MIVKCPNCSHEFIVEDDKIVGECPKCHIKLAFKKGNEIIEKVDIKKIEKEIDSITSTSKGSMDIIEIKEIQDIENRIDEIIE